MPRVVIQPCSNRDAQKHYEDTIANPVPIATLQRHLPPGVIAQLQARYGNNPVPTWGATPGKGDANVGQWEAMSPGDTALFTRDKRVYASGIVSLKARDADLARELWGTTDDGASTWEYLYFLDDVTGQDIPYPAIRAAAGLAEKWNPLRFWVMNDAKSSGVLALLDGREPVSPDAPPSGALVRNAGDIRRNVLTFNAEAGTASPSAIKAILVSTQYWIHDTATELFSPSKFTGIAEMTLARYLELQQTSMESEHVARFDGHASRTAIERALQRPFESSVDAVDQLDAWATDLLGESPFAGVDRSKWRFVTLDAVSRHAADGPVRQSSPADLNAALHAAVAAGEFRPDSITDARDKVLRAITRRQGQPGFRQMLIAAYGGKCAITGCDAIEALEAAHIMAYRGLETNHPTNGLLLRSDIHTLFDLGLIAVNADDFSVLVASQLLGTVYGEYVGRPVTLPADPQLRPNRTCLEQHRLDSRV